MNQTCEERLEVEMSWLFIYVVAYCIDKTRLIPSCQILKAFGYGDQLLMKFSFKKYSKRDRHIFYCTN